MEIHLSNAIVIIDEAHNVEEFSREGASCSLKLDDLHACEEQLNKISTIRFSHLLSYFKQAIFLRTLTHLRKFTVVFGV